MHWRMRGLATYSLEPTYLAPHPLLQGGVSEQEVQLTFDDLFGGGGSLFDEKQLTIVIGVASGVALILLVLLIILCCCCR